MTLSKNIKRGFKNDIRIAKEMVQHATQYATNGTAYLLNIIFDDIKRRSRVLEKLRPLGVSEIYASAITEYDYLKDFLPHKECPQAKYLAARTLTLSTNAFLEEQDLDAVARYILSYGK